jgi:hypothetical protein
MSISKKDREEFKSYLRNCTDNQVLGVLEKERSAGREDYVELAENEAERRNLETQ